MAAFNNYCINCDNLIPSTNLNSEDLYCSNYCRALDQHVIESNNVEKQMVNDAIIKSPLLLPIQDELNSIDGNRNDNNTLQFYKNINIPLNYAKDSFTINSFNDHMAENYYKLWLNNNI